METIKKNKPGPRKGVKYLKTLQKEAVAAEIRTRVMQNADKLFNAQLCRAVGSVMVFEVVETENSRGTVVKTEHVLVRDPHTIKAVLDEGQGANVSVEGSFYLVTEIPPENRAIDSMLDRTFGKAPQSIDLNIDPKINDLKSKIQARATEKGVTYEHELALWNEKYSGNVAPEIKTKLISELEQ